MNLYFRPHPLAPLFDLEREDRDLLFRHVFEEVTGPHFQTTDRVREVIRQAALANLWFFLRCVAGAAGPYDKLNTGLHMDMCNFRSSDHCMAPGAKAFVFLPRDHRKDLYVNTPVLTENRGWTTHRDLRVGDKVFSPSGKAVRVLATSDTYTKGRRYRITFKGGEVIICGSGHLWRRLVAKERNRVGNKRDRVNFPQVVEAQDLRVGDNVGVLDGPLIYPEKELPISPYLLGVWLGDGHSKAARVTQSFRDIAVIERIRALGWEIEQQRCGSTVSTGLFRIGPKYGPRSEQFIGKIRELGLFGDKRIPERYLVGSVEQRMELLRGLMDTDGWSSRTTATLAVTNYDLALGAYKLAMGLALRPRFRTEHRRLHGRPYPVYTVSFQHHADRQPFRLERKRKRATGYHPGRGNRRVVKIEEVGEVPTNCIQVEGDMYLVGESLVPTHNSTIFSHGGDTWEVTRDPDLRIGLVNAIVGRSTGFMNQVQRNIDSNPFYAWLFPEHVPAGSRSERKRWTDKEMVMRSRGRYRVEPTIKPMGAEGAGEGDHFDMLNIDDLLGLGDLTVDMMNSADMYKKMQWFKTNHRTLLDDWNTSRIVGAATRYGMDDVYQWIVERARACYGYPMPGFKPNPDGEWVVYYRNVIEDGVFIQPETMNEEQYRRLQEDDPWTVGLQYENNPLSSKMSEFREYPVKRCGLEMVEGFGYVIVVPGDENYDQKEERIPLSECDVCAGCDPAGTKDGLHSKICQSAVTVWARDYKERIFLLYLRNGYWGPFELFDEIFAAAERFQGHIRIFGVESNAMQKILVPLLNEDKLKRQIVCYFSGIANTGKKDPRIRLTVGKPLQQGKVYAVDSAAIPFVSQKDKFPNSEFQKDILDASEMAVSLTVPPESPEEKEEYAQALEEFADNRSAVTGY